MTLFSDHLRLVRRLQVQGQERRPARSRRPRHRRHCAPLHLASHEQEHRPSSPRLLLAFFIVRRQPAYRFVDDSQHIWSDQEDGCSVHLQ